MKYHPGAALLRKFSPETLETIFEIAHSTSGISRSEVEEFINYHADLYSGKKYKPDPETNMIQAGNMLGLGPGSGIILTLPQPVVPLTTNTLLSYLGIIMSSVIIGGFIGKRLYLANNPDVETRYNRAKMDAESNLEQKLE